MLCTVFGLVGRVLVGDAGCLEDQADELATAGHAGPVEQLVGWVGACFLVGRHDDARR
jgi:hypothetical protein